MSRSSSDSTPATSVVSEAGKAGLELLVEQASDQTPSWLTTKSGMSPLSTRFTPNWLKEANEILHRPHVHVQDLSVPRPQLDLLSGVLFPPVLIDQFREEERVMASDVRIALTKESRADAAADLPGLKRQPAKDRAKSGYGSWHTSIWQEHQAIMALLKSNILFNKELAVQNVKAAPFGAAIYGFEAPHIRENWPPIDIGDQVLLIALDPWMKTPQMVLEAHVYGLKRVTGTVFVRCDELMGKMTRSMVFNIWFLPQDRLFVNFHDAVETMKAYLSRDKQPSDASPAWPKDWLYPDWSSSVNSRLWPARYGESHAHNAVEIDQVKWVDPMLNDEQKEAVVSFAFRTRRVPFLISGPPGTGKTKTVVEAVLQILDNSPTSHILVCGASGPSADTIATRLSLHVTPAQMLRLNDVSRSFEEVTGTLLPFCVVHDNRFMVPSLQDLMAKRIIVCSADEAALLIHARCTNRHLGRLADLTLGALAQAQDAYDAANSLLRSLRGPHFTHCLIDEAAQAHEPQCCIPLSVMIPAATCPKDAPPQICLCGDTKQLGPSIVSEAARDDELDCSLLERLLRNAVYSGHPDTRENKLARRQAKKDTDWERDGDRDKPFVELVRNYRSDPSVIMLPSSLYYADSLVASAPASTMKSALRRWPMLPNQGFPVMFVNLGTSDVCIDEGVSWANPGEVQLIAKLVEDLVKGDSQRHQLMGGIRPEQVSVITPFREQVWRIRLALRAIGLSGVDVGNVESLQGKENRVVFLSTVRATISRIQEDQANNRGVIFQPRRLNVALTRAMELLVVVGNADALCVDADWRAFIAFTRRNRAFAGKEAPQTTDEALASHISYMEEALYRDEELDVDSGLRILAGGMVSSVLRGA